MQTLTRNPRFALGALTALAVIGAVATTAKADGQPVVSLEPVMLGRTGFMIYSDRPSPVATLPVRRVITNGENVEVEYDTSAAPRMVVSRPVARVVGSGENMSVEYDDAQAANMPHAMPNIGGGHNAALWNLNALPRSLR
ncbi:hypothetical protein GXW74_20690 [Roseomonas eburnea]|uniref:Uncharacterized protein n=1 Tax=Neoroseomonas eburnea TaxID=1346889 RepID=A0A9X9XGT6_9PROT|nr:hypothetical protein [Neoroseomonas eburnea]MBR0682922.1 hypothetical protein [Neoroseomonas eburnea]